VQDKTYRAVITSGGKRQLFNLPAANMSGYSLSTKREGQMVRVEVTAHNVSASSVYLFAHARQVIAKAMMMPLVNNKAVTAIDISELPEGITHITIFDGAQTPVCERLFFKTPSKKLELSAKADKQEYVTRKEVMLDLTTPLPSTVSVSVF